MGTAIYTQADVRLAAAAAIRAPSQHNSQPWRFRLADGAIEVYGDPTRRMVLADRTGWAMRVACGAAVFNGRLALAEAGRPASVRLRPDPADPMLMARLTPDKARRATNAEHRLFAAIPRRRSNRRPFRPDPVPADVRAELIAAARAEGCWLDLVLGTGPVAALAEIARGADRVLTRDPHYRGEVAAWTRAAPAPDGVPAEAGGPVSEPQDLLPQRPFGDRHRGPGRDYEAEPLVAVLGASGDGSGDQVTAGQGLQAVLLTAAAAGLGASMLSQPIEVPQAREQLRLALGGRYGAPQMVLRLGYGDPGALTPRRPIEDVLMEPDGPRQDGTKVPPIPVAWP